MKNTLPPLITDSIRWKDLIIESNGMSSINTIDTLFRRRYGRGYFNFMVDTLQPIIHFKKTPQDEKDIFSLHTCGPIVIRYSFGVSKETTRYLLNLKDPPVIFNCKNGSFTG